MDWIEQYFGLNPDGGSGSIEATIIGSAVLLTGALVLIVPRGIRNRIIETWRRIARRLSTVVTGQ